MFEIETNGLGAWVKEFKRRQAFKASRIAFLEDISEILTSDTGGLQGKLLMLAERNAGKTVERVYREIYEVINQGGDISTALRPFFSAKDFAMIAAYDAGASNDAERGAGFLAVSKILGPVQELVASGRKLLLKICFNFSLVLVLWLGMAGGFAKEMAQIAPRNTWNPLSTVVVSSGEWLTAHWMSSFILFGSLIGLLLWAFPNWTGRRRRWWDHHVPGFVIYREFRSSLTLIALASFIKGRQGLGASFTQVAAFANPWEIWYLERMRRNSTKLAGSALLDVGFFDDRTIDRLVMRDEVMPLETSLEQVGLESAHKVVASMRARLDAASKFSSDAAMACGGIVVIAVLLINLSGMGNMSNLR